MVTNVRSYIDSILVREGNGKITNNPKDSGGWTKYGFTEATAKRLGWHKSVDLITRDWAFAQYEKEFWVAPGFINVEPVIPLLADRLLDFGVVAGPGRSAQFLQRCLNVLNRNERDFRDIGVDGEIGLRQTIPALNLFLKKRGEEGKKVLILMVTGLQTNHFIKTAEDRPKDEEWEYGWQIRTLKALSLV